MKFLSMSKFMNLSVIIVHSRFTHCYLMTFPEDHDKFTILSKVLTNDTKVVLTYDTDPQANITHN